MIDPSIAGKRSLILLVVALMLTLSPAPPPSATLSSAPALTAAPAALVERSLSILVDDFRARPGPGDPADGFNRLNGNRGTLNNSALSWGDGYVTATVAPGQRWGGAWMSLNHPGHEGLALNFAALLPAQVAPAYQSQIVALTAQVARATPGRRLRLELKDGDELRWSGEALLSGGPQTLSFDLPALGAISHLVWVLDGAAPGDSVTLERVALTAAVSSIDTATMAFVWSYGMLLANWSPATGLVRDKGQQASGAFDAIQATGSLAAATAQAAQLGVVGRADAIQIVERIGRALLVETPRFHGLWPHFAQASSGGAISIAPGTEWSSVDSVIAAVGLLTAQAALGLDTSGTEAMIQAIDWADLTAGTGGMVAMGYSESGERMSAAWDVFGGESWLVDLAYAGATGQTASLAYPDPPTANGSGFIDELAWLFVAPPSGRDAWGADWAAYRQSAAAAQVAYMPTHHPTSCLTQLGLFGLSAGEIPDPAAAPHAAYQALGVGGRFSSPNDGADLLGAPTVTPHAAALVAALRPQAAIAMWDWLIDSGLFTPLTNVESLMWPAGAACTSDAAVWNSLKGSWNLSLQTLGWGRYLAERAGQTPALWRAPETSPLLGRGYALLAPETSPAASVTPGPNLPTSRVYHTATAMADGRALLVGGSRVTDVILADVAIFDPASNSLTAAAPLHTRREGHSATLLRDGRVLVVGGYNESQQWLGDAELYDPAANAWTVVSPLHTHGTAHTATLMRDGRVLIVGGCIGSGVCTERVEIFDPQTDAWAEAAPLASDRAIHTALLLADGRVLVMGGQSAQGAPSGGDALLYDPQANSWAATGPMVTPRFSAQAARLPDRRVLVAGGVALADALTHTISASAELYDAATNTWAPAHALAQPRYAFTLAALDDGQVLAIGGASADLPQWTDASFIHVIERYDPVSDRWEAIGAIPQPKAFSAAAPLADGRLWVTGGRSGRAGAAYSADTWLVAARSREYMPVVAGLETLRGMADDISPELAAAFNGAYDGTVVTMTGPFVDEDAIKFNDAVAAFEEATGIDIQYEGSKEFEASISIRVDGGNPPDIADFPQPSLLANFVGGGKVQDVSGWINPDWLYQNYNQSWLDMARMAGPGGAITAGVWNRANGKSLVWYPKKAFDAAGYAIPQTWDELLALTEQIAADGDPAWCIGIESGAATGWLATDWVEEIMLRTTSLENYDKWVAGELKFDSPKVKNAVEAMSAIWLNEEYVYGGRAAIVTTAFGDAPTPMFSDPPGCWLHRQGSFITSFFPAPAQAGVDYDFFYLPPIDDAYGKPVLVAGDIYAAFNDRPEVRAVLSYFSSGASVESWIRAGGAISPHNDSSLGWYSDAVDRGVAAIILSADSVRFDGSDLMPGQVGAGSFWKGMTDYVAGTIDLDAAMQGIDAAWPKMYLPRTYLPRTYLYLPLVISRQ